jgi:hypothetical protein
MRCRRVVGTAGLFSPRSFPLRLIFLLGFVIVGCGLLVSQESITLSQVPLAVQNGSAQNTGPYNPQQMLRLVFSLKPPHMQEEEEFLRQLQDPTSPQYHQYLTEQQWNQRFAPKTQDEQTVVAWAQSQGLTITARFNNRLLVDVEGPISVIQKALNVNINAYQLDGKNYFSNDRAPSIPASLSNVIETVLGLNNIEVIHPANRYASHITYPVYAPGPAIALGSQLRGNGSRSKLEAAQKKPGQFYGYAGYDPTDIYSSYAYNYVALQNLRHCCNPLGNPGNSPPQSSVAIAISGDFADSDYSTFLSAYSYLAHNVQRHFVDGTPTCCDGEATADLEFSTAMANSFDGYEDTAEIHEYEAAVDSWGGMLDVLNHILSDADAKVVNMSWGGGEREVSSIISSYHAVFNQMVGEGFTLVAASGDWGSTADCQFVGVAYPSSDPDVTAVGGTSLNTSSGGFVSEAAWSGGPAGCTPPNNDGGSGGGCSIRFGAPTYQSNTCSGDMRSVPDIALNADWYFEPQSMYYDGEWFGAGGTSISSPEMVGFFTQENAYLLYIGGIVGNTCGSNLNAPCSPMGSANPYLYREGNQPFAPHFPFYDITSGCNNNDITEQYGLPYFCAGPGYDKVTGWGSANMLQLAWMINYTLAGDGAGPSISITGPPANRWYNTDQTINWSLSDASGNGHQPVGVSGFSQAWDADPGDPGSEPAPGSGSSYYGLQTYDTSGSANGLAGLSQGCHYGYVRGWDNGGNSALSSYGPLCFDNVPPDTQINFNGNQQQSGHYIGPVQISLIATDNASGVAVTYLSIDFGQFQTYSAPVFSYMPGFHCVEAYSVDVAGNQEGSEEQCFNIDSNSQFTLTVSKSGTGGGSVSSADGGINCGSTCSALYYDEQPVTLTATPQAGSLFTGWRNCDLSFGFSCTLTVTAARTVTPVFNLPVALQFVPLTPCRVVDTRQANGPFGGPAISGGTSRNFALPAGPCPNIPSNAAAYSLNVTTVPRVYLAYLSAWPTGYTRPVTSIMNSFDGRIKANAAIVPAGDSSSVSVFVSNTADVVLDVDGYFVAPNSSTLAFFPLTPCRVIDTRNSNGPLGGPTLQMNQAREFPILQATGCDIPASGAVAYSFNVTAIPANQQSLSYLTVWPSGLQQPVVSTLNALTGTITANAAIVSAGAGGEISVYPAGDNTDLVVDINGYFAVPGSGSQPLSLYTFNPCRVLDTRQGEGAFDGQIVIGVENSPCPVPSVAQAYNLNATVLPDGALGYLTLWPDGQGRPVASTLNALDGAVTSNMAIVPTTNGSIDAYAAGLTQLLLDISSYFAP